MKHWLFDLGNSRLKFTVLDESGRMGEVIALGHDGSTFAAALQDALPAGEVSACLASVASPALTATVLDVLTTRFRSISVARTQRAFAGVRIGYDDPSKLGVDRFLTLIAARARARKAWLAVGVGTAVTLDLLDAHGRHRGGRIGPSPRLMREALHRAAHHLPAQGGEYHEFASDTEDALASGCDGAALGLIERSLHQATTLLGETPALLLHGGGAEALLPQLTTASYAPSLVLEGLAQWARAGIAR
ncbi:type III pantothenate kinase [Pseudoxanthomonas sp. UTMC 1351]|uniref:type III pantothenate kinase n=1 Tax=Pseudoxanthomonas sp. UTMC 1351 TaxID=2695853 RepID=UPI0034CE1901